MKKLPWLIATVAIIAILGGVSYGASESYVITRISQVSPAVRNALHGERGPRGARGAHGLDGVNGTQGPAGPGGAAHGYGTVIVGTSYEIINGYGSLSVSEPQRGVWCLTIPPGANAAEAIMVAPYGGGVAIVGQEGSDICQASEYQIYTDSPSGDPISSDWSFLIP